MTRGATEILTALDDGGEVDLVAGARARLRPSLKRVLNATGVIVHTNLGRAPLAPSVRAAVAAAADGYCNLEMDLGSGERSRRGQRVQALLSELTGAQDALVVNNGAAAALLAVSALAGPGREVTVSRGELIEIGGGFRIPEIVRQSGSILVEVGTTNRTRASDYAAAISDRTGAILRVHQSNFQMSGFVERATLGDLVSLGVPVIDDIGSGVLTGDLPALAGEPTARESLEGGATLACFSADKLLGGPQAGILIGAAPAIEACRTSPLARALRIDKLCLAGLEVTLLLHRDPELARREIPVLAMLDTDPQELAERTRRLAEATGGEIVQDISRVGGGALPMCRAPRPRGGAGRRIRGSRCACGTAAHWRPGAARAHPRWPGPAQRVDAERRRDDGCRRVRGTGALDPAAPLTLGTAGHIDHGKTALVAALTGTDTDRLPEEKARGMSIELGYAQLTLPSGRRLSVVDVPGHERFLRTMVAGATGIDYYLMVIAADEGVRQQTREHAKVLSSLGITTGVVAITKTDLADPSPAIEDATRLMTGAEIVACCARSASNLTDLTAALDRATAHLKSRASSEGPVVMHIDRSFTLTGVGTVVTGTLSSGAIAAGEQLVLYPSDIAVRVRSVQVHDEPREQALAGQRVAVNLARVSRSQVSRGDVLATRGAVTASHFVDVQLDFEPSPAQAQSSSWRVQVHHGTRSTPARIVPLLEARLAQLRCQAPLLARAGERLVIRDATHRDTLGGALVIDPLARRHGAAGAPIQALRRLLAGEQPPAQNPTVAPGLDQPERVARPVVPVPLSAAALALSERLRDEGFSPRPDRLLDAGETSSLAELRAHGLAVRLVHGRHAHVDAVAAAAARLTAIIQAEGQISLPRLRDELGVSRADAKAFLDYSDSAGLTLRRDDDTRILRALRMR